MHLIINTHWDREYRWSFPETQLRLLEAFDVLVDSMEKDKRFHAFHTDSQVCMIDDYLALRPKRKDAVKKLVREGRLQIGPWYTLPAQFLVSGESLTRNLLLGHKISRELGGVMKVGYNIFSWGQVSQLPQLYKQFGIDTILFYRGIDQSALDKLEFWWDAPDGSRALGITFAEFHRLNFWVYVYKPYIFGIKPGTNPKGFKRDGNEGIMTNICDAFSDDINHHILEQPNHEDIDAALEGMKDLMNTLVDKSSTSQLLFLQGFDQESPDPAVPDLVEKINEKIDYGKIEVSTLPDYITRLKDELDENGTTKDFSVLSSEMLSVEKQDDPFGPLYPGVFSARMPIKLHNHDCEVRMEKWAEPAAVWAELLGMDYPKEALQASWKELLQNQQHDGIGGCHVDRITTAMLERYANIRDVAETVSRNALNHIISKIDLSILTEDSIGVIVFNPHIYPQSSMVEAVIDVPLEFDSGIDQKHFKDSAIEMFDNKGNKQPCQVLSQQKETVYAYLKYGSHTQFDARRNTLVFEASSIPPLGYKVFTARPLKNVEVSLQNIVTKPRTLENQFLLVEINSDGSFDLLDKSTGYQYRKLNTFEDEGEQGGPLKFIPPKNEGAYSTEGHAADIVLQHNGPVSGCYRIEREWMLPAELESDLKIHVPHGLQWIDHSEPYRSKRRVALQIVTEIVLRKDCKLLEIRTKVDNTVKDHRLRVVFPVDLKAKNVWADSPYEIVKREIQREIGTDWYEKPLRTFPSSSFVDVSNGINGLALMHYGISEYEVSDDEQQAIYLTLLRAFRTAGNPSETHEQQVLAQCPGKHEFRYAIYPHAGDWQEGEVEKQAQIFTAPMRIAQCTKHSGELKSDSVSFLDISNKKLVLSAVKKAESKDAVIVRFFNPSDEIQDGELRCFAKLLHASKVSLEEVEMEKLEINSLDNTVAFSVKPGEIYSIVLNFEAFS